MNNTEQIKDIIIGNLNDNKAEDVKLIRATHDESIFDYMVISSARSKRHAASLAENIAQEIKKVSNTGISIEGLQVAEWVLIDVGSIIVHIFQPEIRSKYNLEEIWDVNYSRNIDKNSVSSD